MEKHMQHMINPLQPVSYTPNEVAQMLGVKTSTVHAWLSRKEMRESKWAIVDTSLCKTLRISENSAKQVSTSITPMQMAQ